MENRECVLIFPSACNTTYVINYNPKNTRLNNFLSAFDIQNGKGKLKVSDDDRHVEIWFEMDSEFYTLSKCDTLRKAIEHFDVEVIHKKKRMEMKVISGIFMQGKKVCVEIDGTCIERKVQYDYNDGAYVVYRNRRYFAYDFI